MEDSNTGPMPATYYCPQCATAVVSVRPLFDRIRELEAERDEAIAQLPHHDKSCREIEADLVKYCAENSELQDRIRELEDAIKYAMEMFQHGMPECCEGGQEDVREGMARLHMGLNRDADVRPRRSEEE